jgi:hypothetical protein
VLPPLLRVRTVLEPEPFADVGPAVDLEPLLRVATTGASEATGATLRAPLDLVREESGAAEGEPWACDADPLRPGLPAAWCGCSRR